MIEIIATLTTANEARLIVPAYTSAWIKLVGDRGPDLSLFFPEGISTDKVQTVADAINDALCSVSAADEVE